MNDHSEPGAMAALGDVTWRKSRFSPETQCVEVAALADGRIAVRNSNHPDDGVLFFDRAEIDAWIQGCAAGEFDDLKA